MQGKKLVVREGSGTSGWRKRSSCFGKEGGPLGE